MAPERPRSSLTQIIGSALTSDAPGVMAFEGLVTLRSDVAISARAIRFDSAIRGPDRSMAINVQPNGDPVAVVLGGDVGTAVEPLETVTVVGGMGDVVINGVISASDEVTIIAEVGTVDGGPNNEIVVPVGPVAILSGRGIGTTTPLAIQVATTQAITTFGGGIRLRGIGDIVVGEAGIVAYRGSASELVASGEIIVPAGRTISTDDVVTVNTPIRWRVDPNSSTGAGSLGRVITRAQVLRDF